MLTNFKITFQTTLKIVNKSFRNHVGKDKKRIINDATNPTFNGKKAKNSLRKKCPCSELFWFAFFPHFTAFGKIWKITFQEISWKAKYKRSYIYRRKEKTYSRYCKSYLLYLDMLSKSKSKFTWMGMSSQWVKESFMAYHSLIRHFTEQYRFFWDETVILRRKKLQLIRQKCFTNLTSNHHSDKMI